MATLTEPAEAVAASTEPGEADQRDISPQRPMTRLQRGICKEKVYTDGTVKYGFLTHTGEPFNLDEALSDSNWKSAMDAEYLALQKNKTWHLVPPQKGY